MGHSGPKGKWRTKVTDNELFRYSESVGLGNGKADRKRKKESIEKADKKKHKDG